MKNQIQNVRALFAGALFAAAAASLPAAITNEIAKEFSSVTNPGSIWSYGWKSTVGGTFNVSSYRTSSSFENGVVLHGWLAVSSDQPSIYWNGTTNTAIGWGGTAVLPPGSVFICPGPQGSSRNFGVLRFKVPAGEAGSYRLESIFQALLDSGSSGDTDIHIATNGVEIFSQFLPATKGTGYTNTFFLEVGDTVDFLVGRGTSDNYFGDGLKVQAKLIHPSVCTPHRATARAQVVGGFLIGATIMDGGCGYTNPPLVLVQGGGGTGAVGTAVISDGQVVAINMSNAGCCYTTNPLPQIVIASPPFVPTVSISVSRVRVNQHVVLGRRYVLMASEDFIHWTPTGPAFTAESEEIVTELDVDITGRFFKLEETP